MCFSAVGPQADEGRFAIVFTTRAGRTPPISRQMVTQPGDRVVDYAENRLVIERLTGSLREATPQAASRPVKMSMV